MSHAKYSRQGLNSKSEIRNNVQNSNAQMTDTEILVVQFSIPEHVRNTFWSLDIRICVGFSAWISEFFPLCISLTALHTLSPAEDMGQGQNFIGVTEKRMPVKKSISKSDPEPFSLVDNHQEAVNIIKRTVVV